MERRYLTTRGILDDRNYIRQASLGTTPSAGLLDSFPERHHKRCPCFLRLHQIVATRGETAGSRKLCSSSHFRGGIRVILGVNPGEKPIL
jgi:hypothetical protein